ncbi:MAG: SPOR domain-containing protein [Candidatus Krumholzibacteriota bacterium]|nr:SPOR domain-containing protein [Candidatus Krumholzibacteriota bacterium]
MKTTTWHRRVAAAAAILAFLAAMDADASVRRIRQLVAGKRYEQARMELLDEIGGLGGNSRSEGLLLLADLETDPARTIALYERVIEEGRPREALRARVAIGKIRYASGEYREAARILSELPAGGNGGDRLEGVYFRALCWKRLGDLSRARRDLETIDRGPFLYWSYLTRAEIDMLEGRIADAVERYETVASSRSYPFAGFRLGECYEILGEREKALDVYNTILTQFPRSLEAPKAREKIQMIGYAGSGGERAGRREKTTTNAFSDGSEDLPGVGFTIQLGAFSEQENAERFAAELRDLIDGLRIERIERGGRTWHRIRVGRYGTREEAEAAAARIKNETGYSSKILPLG